MSYASCLINSFGKQTIQDLRITGSFTNSSPGLLQSKEIDDNIVENDVTTMFYQEVLPAGIYFVRGSVGLLPVDSEAVLLEAFTIFESSSSLKYPLSQMTFPVGTGLADTQFLGFSTIFQSDGVNQLEFSIQVIGGGNFKIIPSTLGDNAIQVFKLG
jgi:hypothetical protein